MENARNYLLVTACKNEAVNLPDLIESIIKQTIRPIMWVIVDDGSTDDTPAIAQKAAERHDWIHVIRLAEGKRDLGLHYANILKISFKHAILRCESQYLEYDYLGNLDGDLSLPPTFYENLMKEFEDNPRLGIASGGTDHLIDGRIIHANISVNEPSGGHMLIREVCFNECGGIPNSYSIDSVLKAKARLRNWQTRRFENNRAVEIRDVSSAEGYWKGKVQSGKSAYFLNYHPIHVIAKSIYYTYKRPYYIGLAYLYGYFSDLIKRNEKIKDTEIKNYFWNKWKKIFKQYNLV